MTLGRFAPEGHGAQQAYRVVNGRKVAIATQVQTSEQTKRQAEEVKASSTDEQMLEPTWPGRTRRSVSTRRRSAEAAEAAEPAAGAAGGAEGGRSPSGGAAPGRGACGSEGSGHLGAEDHRTQDAGSSWRAPAGALGCADPERAEQKRRERQQSDAERLERRAQGGGGPGTGEVRRRGDPFDYTQYDIWNESGHSPEALKVIDAPSTVRLWAPDGEKIEVDNSEFDMLVDKGGHIVDGAAVLNRLISVRNGILRDAGAKWEVTGRDAIDDFQGSLHDTLVEVIDEMATPNRQARINDDVYVWIDPHTFATLSNLTKAFLDATDDASTSMLTDLDFPVVVYDSRSGILEQDTCTLRIPTFSSSSYSMQVSKADEPWDESEVNRDAIGRFAPEGHREVNVGGRKMLVKVEQGGKKVESRKEIERSSTDTQDLEWVAQKNRSAAMRRRRLARLRATQVAQRAQVTAREQVQTAPVVQEQKQVRAKKLVRRQELLRGLTKEQIRLIEYDRTKIREAIKTLEPSSPVDPSNRAEYVVMNPASTPVGRALEKLRVALADPLSPEQQAWQHQLHVSQNSASMGMGGVRIVMARGVANVVVGEPTGDVPSDDDDIRESIESTDDFPVIDPDSADLLAQLMTGDEPLDFEVQGDGTDAAPFELRKLDLGTLREDSEESTEVRSSY